MDRFLPYTHFGNAQQTQRIDDGRSDNESSNFVLFNCFKGMIRIKSSDNKIQLFYNSENRKIRI